MSRNSVKPRNGAAAAAQEAAESSTNITHFALGRTHLRRECCNHRRIGVPRVVLPHETQAERPQGEENVHEASEAVDVAAEDGQQEVSPVGDNMRWAETKELLSPRRMLGFSGSNVETSQTFVRRRGKLIGVKRPPSLPQRTGAAHMKEPMTVPRMRSPAMRRLPPK